MLCYHSDCKVERCDTECGADTILTASEGYFTTKGYPSQLPPFSECKWTIRVPEDKFIYLEFEEFNVVRNERSGECEDYVLFEEVGQEVTEMERLGIGMEPPGTGTETDRQICGTPPPFFLSSTSELQVVFQTGLDVRSLGFKVYYRASGNIDTSIIKHNLPKTCTLNHVNVTQQCPYQ